MSTLSDQSRKLRGWAAQFAEREEQFGVVSRALVKDLEEAADTILRMRDNLREADRCRNIELEENAKLRELFAEVWPIAEYAGYDHELRRARELMRELGIEVGE